jgi:ABC-2 type transport system ATP-binding protein
MIEIAELHKSYNTGKTAFYALDNLSLSIGPGEIFGFIGPNGAGKSTTMKILSCLIRPDSGSARVAGFDVMKDGDSIRRIIGYMPDFLGVYEDLTVAEYLHFFAAAFEIPRARRSALVDQVLELTDLTAKKPALVDSLSRGMQQRLGVARVLIHEPKVLLLDEPASGLDPRARIEMRSLLQELRKMGKTLMVSSHILTELAEMCTSIGIIERGKLLYAGSIDDALSRVRLQSGQGLRVSVVLEPHGCSSSHALEILRADARITKAELTLAPAPGHGGELLVELAPGTGTDPASPHVVVELLLAAGARLRSVHPELVDLEDAFLRLTTGAVQ